MDIQTEITNCGDCPFQVQGNNTRYCNHPLVADDLEVINTITINENKNVRSLNPTWCPLREIKEINIGITMLINLNKHLFEENIK